MNNHVLNFAALALIIQLPGSIGYFKQGSETDLDSALKIVPAQNS